ncbi:hypothetical protein [Burkholderia humptydooensis]|nr:hypothetical protein [Burkholderia humptydooensis]
MPNFDLSPGRAASATDRPPARAVGGFVVSNAPECHSIVSLIINGLGKP